MTATSPHHLEMMKKSQSNDAKRKRKATMKQHRHQQGSKNSQFGTCWITNGKENRKIKKEPLDNLETGWYKGRICINPSVSPPVSTRSLKA